MPSQPDTESVQHSVDYCVTLTLVGASRRLRTHEQLSQSSRLVLDILLKHNIYATFTYELTTNFDIHYHGIIKVPLSSSKKIRNMVMYIKDLFRRNKLIGFTCVKVCEDYHGWVEYIKKDIHYSYKNMGVYPFIIDDYNIQNHFEFFDDHKLYAEALDIDVGVTSNVTRNG